MSGEDSKQNDPYRFLSTRLVRELIAADSQAEAAGEEIDVVAARLLDVVAEGLSQPGVALLGAATLGVVAARGLGSEEQALLQAPPPGGNTPLVRRALEERRVFLLGRGSREPLLPALREVRGEWSGLVLVPLCDREQCAGVLVLAATEQTLPAAFLRSLAPAFRLLSLLLHPGRRTAIAEGEVTAPPGDAERYVVEIEELRSQLAEARDQCRAIENEESSSQAAQRAESESLRARVAELEASAAAGGDDDGVRQELESEIARRSGELDEGKRRIEELEAENRSLVERMESAEGARVDAEARAAQSLSSDEALRDVMNEPGLGDVEPESQATSLPDLEGADLQLGEIAQAAAAAIGDTEESRVEDIVDPADEIVVGDASDSHAVADAPLESCPLMGVWHLDSDPGARAWAGELTAQSGALFWTGDGAPPATTKSMVLLNLFDESVTRALDLVDGDVESLVYAADAESGQGFELGRIGWIRRPLDPAVALQRIQSRVARRLGGIVIVSAQLRELAGLRQALAEVDAAGSVACDARQASDLLDIVRRPDAVLIDLMLDGGQALALARQLRTEPETSDVPILFLMPETINAETMRADADRANVLGPYGSTEARRLLNGALAHIS